MYKGGFPRPKKDIGEGSNIKSIQRGSTIVNTATIDIPIAKVDLAKSIVLISYDNTNYTPNRGCVKADLTTAINLRLNLRLYIVDVLVSWQIIEFNNVKTFQKGTLLLNATPQTLTVASVTTGKCLLVCSWDSGDNSNAGAGYYSVRYELTNATTLTFVNWNITGQDKNVAWQLIEFN